MGLPAPDDAAVVRSIGTPLRLVVPAMYRVTPEVAEAYIAIYQKRADQVMTDLTVMLDGAAGAIHALHDAGYALAIVSQKLRYRLEEVLLREGLLDAFAAVLGDGDVPEFKPDPRGLLLAIQRVGSTPERSVYVGDTPIDAETARRAGVAFIAVLTGPSPQDESGAYQPLAVLPSVRELPAFLAGLQRSP
jgi:phosphoglycolate phosphatase